MAAFALDLSNAKSIDDLDEEERRKKELASIGHDALQAGREQKTADDLAKTQAEYQSAGLQQVEPEKVPNPPVQPQFPMAEPRFGGGPVVSKSEKEVTTTNESTKISKEARAAHVARMAAMDDTATAIRKEGEAKAEVQNAHAQAKQEMENNSVNLALEEQEREKRAKDLADRRMAEYEKTKEQLAASRDYKGIWANRSTGDRVLAALSIAMGAFSASKTGGENHAMKILDSAIDQDYKQWQDRYGAMERAAVRSGADAEKASEKFDVALAARKAAQRQAAIDMGNTMVEKAKTDEQRQAGMRLVQDQMEKKAKDEEEFASLTNIKSRTIVQQQITKADPAALLGGAARGLGYFGAGGATIGTTGDPKRDEEIRKKAAPFMQFDSLMGKLQESYAKGRLLPGSKEAQERGAIVSKLDLAIKNNEELGQLVGGDWQIIHDQIGKGGAMFAFNPLPKLEEARRLNRDGFAMKLDSLGVPGEQTIPKMLGGGGRQQATEPAPMDEQKLASAMKWLNSPEAKKNPEKADQVREELKRRRGLH